MKKILMIAPASFPINGAEHIVNIKLLQVLSNANFEIDLISKKNNWEHYPSMSLNSLGIKLKSVSIINVDNKFSIITLLQHILSYFKFGAAFKGSHWALKALPLAIQLIKKNNYDYILTKNGAAPLIGFYLKKKYGLKWIATWNDPYPNIKYPQPYGKGVNAQVNFFSRKLLTDICTLADIHIFPSERLRNYMLQYLPIPKNKTEIVPHVANKVDESYPLGIESKTLKMIHSGNLKSPRDPSPFLLALKSFIVDLKDPKILVTFVGVSDSGFQKKIVDLALDEYVEILDAVDYYESINLLSKYHCAVIIEAPCEEGIFLPTKVSDYQQIGIPVFSISPKIGVLNDLYNKNHISYFADCTNYSSIKNEIKRIFNDFNQNQTLKKGKINSEFLPENIIRKYDSF